MRRTTLMVGTIAAGTLLALTAPTAQAATTAQVTGQTGSTFACLDDATKTGSIYVTISAPTEAALEGPDVTVTRIEAVNPCAHTVSGYLGVRDRKTGATFDFAANVRPGSSFTVGRGRLQAYGLNTRYRSTNTVGSATSAAVAGPGVVVVSLG
jgi:hypothetical protein